MAEDVKYSHRIVSYVTEQVYNKFHEMKTFLGLKESEFFRRCINNEVAVFESLNLIDKDPSTSNAGTATHDIIAKAWDMYPKQNENRERTAFIRGAEYVKLKTRFK